MTVFNKLIEKLNRSNDFKYDYIRIETYIYMLEQASMEWRI